MMKASCVDMPSINMLPAGTTELRAEGDQGRDHDEPHLITEIQNKNVSTVAAMIVARRALI